jgi:ABC-2 type transport system ATP-binding protein
MIYISILLSAIIGVLFIYLLQKKNSLTIEKSLKILSVLLFIFYSLRFFFDDAIDNTFNLFYFDIITPVDAASTWIFSRFGSLLMLLLRWATLILITWGVIGSFFKQRFIKFMMASFGIFFALLNLIFFKANLIAYFGNESFSFFSIRGIQFAFVVIFLFILSFTHLISIIQTKMVLHKKDVYNILVIFFISSLGVMPLSLLYNLFGNYGESPLDFNSEHLFLIALPFVIMIVSYFVMFSKRQEDRNIMLMFLVLAGVFQYFYLRRTGIASMPLHLCNTAIILMLVSFVFKLKGVFYFNYFANVLGAMLAIMLPNYSSDLFSISVSQYWYNHLYAFFIPILGVAFHTFERPTLKLMLKAIGVFSIYYVLVLFLNSWLNNYTSVDYFFTYGDFITSKLNAESIQYANVIAFPYQGLTFTFYWLYQILLYTGFIFLMFMSWYVYDAIFQFADRYYNLYIKRKKMNVDILELKRLLDGRELSEPINPGGVDMLKISHFSKQYGNSKNKAVDDFSLEVHSGEVFGFLGHNGAGKSTTIKSLVGIQSITDGEMEICGYSIKTQPLEAKLNIGYVSDNHAVYEKLTGREFINYVADLYQVPKEVREERLNRYLERFKLAFAIDNEIKSFSHGMKQKLIVIASLIHEPKVWILDEPLTGLDPTSAYQIKECMREHANKGNIVFFSSHVIEVVEKICDRIAIIGHGKLEGVYDVKELLSKGISIEQLYMDSVQNHSPLGGK